MYFVPALLMFTTLTSVGLVAAWAAASTRHWFVRTMAFLAVASLPLLIPAYEGFVALIVEGATVGAGVEVWRRATGSRRGSSLRLSVKNTLLAVAPLAVVCAVVVRLPSLTPLIWLNVFCVGFISGLLVLLATWVASGARPRWWWRVPIALAATALFIQPGVVRDETIDSVVHQHGWPPERSTVVWPGVDQPGNEAWGAIGFGLLLFAALAAWLLHSSLSADRGLVRRAKLVASLLLATAVAVPPALCLIVLANPLPVPEAIRVDDNGFDDFEQAVASLPQNPLVNNIAFYVDTAPATRVIAAAAEGDEAITLVRSGLKKDVWQEIDFSRNSEAGRLIMELRTITDLFYASARANRLRGDADTAAKDYADLTLFGSSQCRGGLLIDLLVGVASGGQGVSGLHDVGDGVSPEARDRVISKLSEAEIRMENFETVYHRDRVWTQHAYGWHGHLCQWLDDIRGPTWVRAHSKVAYDRYLTILRILQTEYAVLQFRDRFGRLPESLTELSSEILSPLPMDPFASDGSPLRYRRNDGTFLVYSVWVDGVDDSGRPPSKNKFDFIDWGAGSVDGDLSLDALYREELIDSPTAEAPAENELEAR